MQHEGQISNLALFNFQIKKKHIAFFLLKVLIK